MITQAEQAASLKKLHIKDQPVILFNIWDAGSARAIQEVGAKVISTSSWSVASAHGCEDGEKLTLDLVLSNLKRIIVSVNLPVTIDLEGGYGQNPTEVQATIEKIIEAGAVGINFEDQIVGGEGLYSIEDQCARIKAIRAVADRMSIPLFVNARTDIFLKAEPNMHNDNHFEEAIRRVIAYAEFGADGYFVPGLRNEKYIKKLCEISPVPINIMMLPGMPLPKRLTELGVSRISYGPGPYCQVMDVLKEAGRMALSVV